LSPCQVSYSGLKDGVNDDNSCFYLNSSPMESGVDEYTNNYVQSESYLNLPNSCLDIFSNGLFPKSGKLSADISREQLGLLLSCHLAELHHGQISIQGSPASGYRYVLSLPLKFATSSTSEL
jgi:hypothetical protein